MGEMGKMEKKGGDGGKWGEIGELGGKGMPMEKWEFLPLTDTHRHCGYIGWGGGGGWRTQFQQNYNSPATAFCAPHPPPCPYLQYSSPNPPITLFCAWWHPHGGGGGDPSVLDANYPPN